jgi:hypothetical protein
MSTEDPQFMECAECRSKPGSPTLCPSCLHNRTLVSKLSAALKTQDSMAQENEDLWREVAALASDLNAHKATLLGLQADAQGIVGFSPRSAQATMKLFQMAFLLAIHDEDFKKEHEKQMLDWRKRLGKAIAEQRDLRLMEEQVEALSRKVGEVEKVINRTTGVPAP